MSVFVLYILIILFVITLLILFSLKKNQYVINKCSLSKANNYKSISNRAIKRFIHSNKDMLNAYFFDINKKCKESSKNGNYSLEYAIDSYCPQYSIPLMKDIICKNLEYKSFKVSSRFNFDGSKYILNISWD